MKKIKYKPFKIEMHTVGGYHDGVRSRIMDTGLDNPIVTMHETMHERIFNLTIDGKIHSSYCLCIEHNLLKKNKLDILEDSLDTFIEASRLPHEVFATYLSIKSLPSSSEKNLLSQHSNEYLEYYHTLADIFDKDIQCSYLQYLIAWGCALAIFSSPLVERLKTIDISVPIVLSDDESPISRFNILIEILKSKDYIFLREILVHVAELTFEHHNIKPWDILFDSEWEKVQMDDILNNNKSRANILENILSESIQGWLSGIMPFTYVHSERLSKDLEYYKKFLLNSLNINIEITTVDYKDPTFDLYLKEASDSAKSRIINNDLSILKEMIESASYDKIDFSSYSSFAIYSSCPSNNEKSFNIFFWLSDDENSKKPSSNFLNVCYDEIQNILNNWLTLKRMKRNVPYLRSIIIAINGYEAFMDYLSIKDSVFLKSKDITKKLCWYWWGNYTEVYTMFSSEKKTMFITNYATEEHDEILSKSPKKYMEYMLNEYNGNTIQVLKLNIDIGLFVRIYPYRVACNIHPLEKELKRNGSIKEMSPAMKKDHKTLAFEALYSAQILWEEY